MAGSVESRDKIESADWFHSAGYCVIPFDHLTEFDLRRRGVSVDLNTKNPQVEVPDSENEGKSKIRSIKGTGVILRLDSVTFVDPLGWGETEAKGVTIYPGDKETPLREFKNSRDHVVLEAAAKARRNGIGVLRLLSAIRREASKGAR